MNTRSRLSPTTRERSLRLPLALAAATLIASTTLFSGVSANAASSVITVNPLAAYSEWNVVSFGDLTIHAESEGPVAVGGDLTFSETNVAFHTSTDVALLVGGKVDFSKSTGALNVLSEGSIKIGDLSESDVFDRDENGAAVSTRVVASGDGYNSTPAVASNHRQDASTVSAPGEFAETFSHSAAVDSATLVAGAATSVCNTDQVITPAVSGGKANLSLSAGANYWNLTVDELSSLNNITFSGAITPSEENPLIINVSGDGAATLNLTMAGARDPHGILFNFLDATAITQTGDSIDGSILAPRASYEKTSANLQGTAIVATANLDGSEEHYFPFRGFVTICATTPVPAEEPKTSEPAEPSEPSEPSEPATPAVDSPVDLPTLPVEEPSVSLPTLAFEDPDLARNELAYTGQSSLPIGLAAFGLLALGLGLAASTRLLTVRRKQK